MQKKEISKLIYFTLGNNVNYLKLANLCISSLYKNGYDGDFLFITNMKNEILGEIEFKKEPYFLETDQSDLIHSSSNKLKLYKFKEVSNFDKIIFSDLDIIWTSNPDKIFDLIETYEFYMSNEDALMSDEWWGSQLLFSEERVIIQQGKIKGVNAGIFAFSSKMVHHLEKIENYLKQNIHLINQCLEQPYLNVYLFRNKIYNTKLTNLVSHSGYHLNNFDGVVLHFAGGPGNFSPKYEKMLNFFENNIEKE